MIIQGLLVISLLLGACDVSANSTPPNQKARSGRGARPKGTPRPPRPESGANAAAPAQPAEAEGKAEEAARQVAAAAEVSQQDARKLVRGKAKIVGNETLSQVEAGMLGLESQVRDLQAKLAAAEKELEAARGSHEAGKEMSDLRRERSELTDRVADLQRQLTAVNSKTANLEALARQADADKDKIAKFAELQRAQCAAETARQELAIEKERIAAELKKALADLEDARFQAQQESEDAAKTLADNLSLKKTELLEVRKALEEAALNAKREAEAALTDLRKAVDAAEQKAKEAAEKAADIAKDLAAKEAELKNAQAAPAKNEGADKEKEGIQKALADLDKKYQAAQANFEKAEKAAQDAKRKLDEADGKSNAGFGENKDQGAMRKERDVAQANAKFYKNIGMTAAGALAVGGGVILWRTLTGGPRLATRVKADEMISFITHYEGSAQELVTMVVKTFGEPAKSDRAMYVKLNEKLVQSIDLLEEFLSWKSEPVSQEFVEAEDALLRLLMVRTALLKLMPADEPVAANEAVAAA
jgi:hypothetical protein